jgi:glycosyltransferase involved in cell wall biosynthesis
MNIIHVPRRFVASDWGGTETTVLEFARGQRDLGHSAKVFCPAALTDETQGQMGGVDVQRFPYFYPFLGLDAAARRRMDLTGGNLFSFSLLRALLNEPEMDVLHLHTMKRLGGTGRLAARRRGIPYVVSVHGGLMDVPADEQARLQEPTKGTLEWGRALGWMVGSRKVVEDADAVLCVSPEEQRRIQRALPDQRVEFLPNGVDVRRWTGGDGEAFRSRHGIPQDAHVLLCVGRIDPQKNQRMLVDLLPSLMSRIPGVHLVLVGHVTDDAYHADLVAQANATGVSRHLTVLPGLAPDSGELADAFRSADQFVMPSKHEPFGIVALEAWAACLPVVASRRGGLPAFIQDGRTGLLADPDEPKTFLRAICDLAGRRGLRGKLGINGRAEAERHYTWDRINERLLKIYTDVSGRRRMAA